MGLFYCQPQSSEIVLGFVADSSTATGLKWASPAATASGLNFIGTTTFTSTQTINVNDVFSTTYDNYRIIINSYGSSGGTMNLRLRVSGTDSSTTYQNQRVAGDGTSGVFDRAGSTQAFIGDIATQESNIIVDVFQPFLASKTGFLALNACNNSGGNNMVAEFLASAHNTSTSYTGFSLLPANNNTGTVSVYGYAKA